MANCQIPLEISNNSPIFDLIQNEIKHYLHSTNDDYVEDKKVIFMLCCIPQL